VTKEEDRKLADVILPSGLNAASGRPGLIVGRFGPGVQGAFPVQRRPKAGTPDAQSYCIFNSCQRFGAVLLNRQSAKTPYSRTYQDRRLPYSWLSEWNLTLSRCMIAGRHQWRCRYMALTHFALQKLAPHIRGGGGHESG
jgi:hypothetical protein